jgi:hypothetical protein
MASGNTSPITLSKEEKRKFLLIIKDIDLQALVIPEEANRQWFKFGAYNALSILSDDIISKPIEEGE